MPPEQYPYESRWVILYDAELTIERTFFGIAILGKYLHTQAFYMDMLDHIVILPVAVAAGS